MMADPAKCGAASSRVVVRPSPRAESNAHNWSDTRADSAQRPVNGLRTSVEQRFDERPNGRMEIGSAFPDQAGMADHLAADQQGGGYGGELLRQSSPPRPGGSPDQKPGKRICVVRSHVITAGVVESKEAALFIDQNDSVFEGIVTDGEEFRAEFEGQLLDERGVAVVPERRIHDPRRFPVSGMNESQIAVAADDANCLRCRDQGHTVLLGVLQSNLNQFLGKVPDIATRRPVARSQPIAHFGCQLFIVHYLFRFVKQGCYECTRMPS